MSGREQKTIKIQRFVTNKLNKTNEDNGLEKNEIGRSEKIMRIKRTQ